MGNMTHAFHAPDGYTWDEKIGKRFVCMSSESVHLPKGGLLSYNLRRDGLMKERKAMVYRVAIRMDRGSPWQWRSTPLSSMQALFGFLRLYQALPVDRVRVFSSATREEL